MKEKLHCPIRNCLRPPLKVGRDNPPFEYTPDDAIKTIVCHLHNDHSLLEIITFFEDYMANELLQSSNNSRKVKI